MTEPHSVRGQRCRAPYASPLLLAIVLGLAGCAVGPDYRTPLVSTPSRWTEAAPASSKSAAIIGMRWWTGLHDRTLDSLIEDAVAGNLDVAAAKARVREARASRRQALGALLPTVEGSAAVTGNKTANSAPSDTAPVSATPYTLYQAGFDASWELDLFGGNKRTLEAATRGLEASYDDLDSTLLTLLGDVASNYVEARGYQARAALARRTAKSQRETAALTQSKFEAGSASAVDAAKASAQAASTEANIPALETAYAEAVHRLGILLGRDPGALSARLSRAAPIPTPRGRLPAGLPADVLRNRPDVRAAERRLAQYTAKIGVAEAALYPSVSLTGTVSTNAQKIGDLGRASTIGWSYGPAMTIPIFSGGRLQAAVEIADAQRDQYDAAFRSAVLTALEDVENALVALAKERVRSTKLADSAGAYGDAARLSRSLYQNGASSFLDVLDAERYAYSAEDSLLQSHVTIATDWIALGKALGGGWDRPLDVAKPAVVDTGTGPHPIDWKALDVAH